MKRVLFVCSQNRLRSPTAEQVFSTWPGIEAASAGTNNDADVPVSVELIQWADLIFVMEQTHKRKLSSRFQQALKGKRIICLDIPDRFGMMDAALIDILKRKVTPFLP